MAKNLLKKNEKNGVFDNMQYRNVKNIIRKVTCLITILLVIILFSCLLYKINKTISKIILIALAVTITISEIIYFVNKPLRNKFKDSSLKSYLLWIVSVPIMLATCCFLIYYYLIKSGNVDDLSYLLSWIIVIYVFASTSIWLLHKLFKSRECDYQLLDLILLISTTFISIFSIIVNYQDDKNLKCLFITIVVYFLLSQTLIKCIQYYRNKNNERPEQRTFSENNRIDKNNNWNNTSGKIRVAEVVFLLLIVVGIVIIVYASKNNNIVYEKEETMDGFRIGLLGAQATIIALTISVVALISNNIAESHMGITVSDYYLNIRPLFFKQNRVIYVAILLIFVSFISYLKNSYVFLYYSFIITLGLIVLSVTEIYGLFRGITVAKNEIKLYVLSEINKNTTYNKKLNLYNNFIHDWSEKSPSQNHIQYEEYNEIFFAFVDNLLAYNNSDLMSEIENGATHEILSLLRANDEIIQGRGIKLVNDIYGKVWVFITSKDFKPDGKQKFELLSYIYDDLKFTCEKIPLEVLDRNVEWRSLIDYINTVECCLLLNNKNEYYSYGTSANKKLALLVAYILKFKEIRRKEESDYFIKKWGSYLSNQYIGGSFKIPEDKKEKYLWNRCKSQFFLVKGFIDCLFKDCIIENFFLRGMTNSYTNTSNTEILFFITVDCYLYYLADKEDVSCVTEELKQCAKDILENNDVCSINEYYFSKNYRYIVKYRNLQKDLELMLKESESWHMYGMKRLIMEDVVREFYIFLMAINSYKYTYGKKFEIPLLDPPSTYINQLFNKNEEDTKQKLRRFYRLFGDSKGYRTDKFLGNKISAIYEKTKSYIEEQFKKEEENRAKRAQNRYTEEIKVDRVVDSIRNKVNRHLKNKFGDLHITNENIHESWTSSFEILDCNLFTDMVNEDVSDRIFSAIDANLALYLIDELYRRKLLRKEYKSSFVDDSKYIEFLRSNDLYVLLGSEYILKNTDYQYRDKFEDYENKCIRIYTEYASDFAMAAKKESLQINIKDIRISIEPLIISRSGAEYDEQNNVYRYEVTNGIKIPFTEDELTEYLKNIRKILKIIIDVEISVATDNIGVIIALDDNE